MIEGTFTIRLAQLCWRVSLRHRNLGHETWNLRRTTCYCAETLCDNSNWANPNELNRTHHCFIWFYRSWLGARSFAGKHRKIQEKLWNFYGLLSYSNVPLWSLAIHCAIHRDIFWKRCHCSLENTKSHCKVSRRMRSHFLETLYPRNYPSILFSRPKIKNMILVYTAILFEV